jgi:hypothetical protein
LEHARHAVDDRGDNAVGSSEINADDGHAFAPQTWGRGSLE